MACCSLPWCRMLLPQLLEVSLLEFKPDMRTFSSSIKSIQARRAPACASHQINFNQRFGRFDRRQDHRCITFSLFSARKFTINVHRKNRKAILEPSLSSSIVRGDRNYFHKLYLVSVPDKGWRHLAAVVSFSAMPSKVCILL